MCIRDRVASVAIVCDDNMLGEYTVNYKKTHSQTLLPMLDEVATSMMNKARDFYEKHKLPVLLALLVISIILPFVVKQALILRYICTIMMYATLAGSLNVINGYSGQTCLGQAGFFAIGAYTCASLSKNLGIDFWIVLPIAGILAALVGLIVSLSLIHI